MFTKEEIIENNWLIATFLDGEVREIWKIGGRSEYAWFGETAEKWRKEKLGIGVGTALLEGHLCFHKSWDWLMPVIQKMCSLGNIVKFQGFKNIYEIMIDSIEPDTNVIKAESNDPLLLAYESVVKFVKFYNSAQ